MPTYEATLEELNKYGAGLNIWQQIALLQAWSPLYVYVQRLMNESDPYKKSLIGAEAAEWVASRTDAKLDDELARLIGGIVRTSEFASLVHWAAKKMEAAR